MVDERVEEIRRLRETMDPQDFRLNILSGELVDELLTALAQAERERAEFARHGMAAQMALTEARAEVERLMIINDGVHVERDDAEADLALLRAAGLGMRSALRPIYDYVDLTESRRKEVWDAMAAWDRAARDE